MNDESREEIKEAFQAFENVNVIYIEVKDEWLDPGVYVMALDGSVWKKAEVFPKK